MSEMSLDGFGDIGEDIPGLLPTGLLIAGNSQT